MATCCDRAGRGSSSSACSSRPPCFTRVLSFIGADLHLRFGLELHAGRPHGRLFRRRRPDLHPRWSRCWSTGSDRSGSRSSAAPWFRSASSLWHSSRSGGCPFGAMVLIGLGFYMVHNTLQTNATQMAPQARGTALAIFSSVLYFGITTGVAIAGPIVDRYTAVPVFLASAIGFPLVSAVFALRPRPQAAGGGASADQANKISARARRARFRRAPAARPGPADCRRARTSASAAACP